MPGPIAHTAAGAASYLLFKKRGTALLSRTEVYLLLFCMFLTLLPDLDFLPGILLEGNPKYYHRGYSHSLIVLLVLSVFIAYLLKKVITGLSFKRLFLSCSLSLLSHPVLDCVNEDTVFPYGVKLFMPITEKYYYSEYLLFKSFDSGGTNLSSFIISIFNKSNIIESAIETLFFSILVCFVICLKNRHDVKKLSFAAMLGLALLIPYRILFLI